MTELSSHSHKYKYNIICYTFRYCHPNSSSLVSPSATLTYTSILVPNVLVSSQMFIHRMRTCWWRQQKQIR